MARFSPSKFALASLAFLSVISFGGQIQTSSEAEKAIETGIGKLRSVPDQERGAVTKRLALQIRQLTPGMKKVGLASGLANLSTEGDFGHDTLQEVADTLAQSLREQPIPSKNGEPAYQYLELAQLARFEHVSVSMKGQEYAEAMAKVVATEQARAKADFTLTDIEGKTWTLSALRGKVVLVNFWATWCPPCRKEMPDLETLSKQFKDQGLIILAISDEDASKVKPFISEHQYTYPILLDPGRKINTLYLVDGIPKSFVYDRKGKLVAQAIDMRTMGQMLTMLKAAGLR